MSSQWQWASAATLHKVWGSDTGRHLRFRHRQSCRWYNKYAIMRKQKGKLTVVPFRDPLVKGIESQPKYFGLLQCRSAQPRQGTSGGSILDGNLMRPSYLGSWFGSDKIFILKKHHVTMQKKNFNECRPASIGMFVLYLYTWFSHWLLLCFCVELSCATREESNSSFGMHKLGQ